MKLVNLNKLDGKVTISISSQKEPILNKFKKVSREIKTLFGEICLVEKLSDNQVFELLIIRNNFINDLNDFERQILIYTKLHNQYLCNIIDFSQDLRNFYVVQEFVTGIDLHSYILSNSNFTEYVAGKIMMQLFRAVNVCHKEGLYSSEISFSDIYIEETKFEINVKLCNFLWKRNIKKENINPQNLNNKYLLRPPENFVTQPCCKSDIWCLSLIMYICLSGLNPFSGENKQTIKRKIQYTIVKFNQPIWKKLSKESMFLIQNMIQFDPDKRISSDSALNDPWIKKYSSYPKEGCIIEKLDISQNIKLIKAYYELHNYFPIIVSRQLFSKKDEPLLRGTFYEFDKNEDGFLSASELIIGFTTLFGDRYEALKEVEHALRSINFDSYKKIKFNDFLKYFLSKDKEVNEEFLISRFKYFDSLNNGKIDKEDFMLICLPISNDPQFITLLSQSDKFKSPQVLLEDFKQLMNGFFLSRRKF